MRFKPITYLSLLLLLGAFGLALHSFPSSVLAQSQELTKSDEHALLYAKSLQFSPDSEPIIRIGIAEGLDSIEFTPATEFRIMPGGSASSIIEVKGKKRYRLSLKNGKAGQYQHGIILMRTADPKALQEAQERWESLGLEVESISLGAIFALRGSVFDNRESVLLIKRSPDLQKMQLLLSQLRAQDESANYDLYTELVEYPTAEIILEALDKSIVVHNKNMIWLDFADQSVRFHQLPSESGKPEDMGLSEQVIATPDRSGRLSLVQAAKVETVLRGIVPAEIFASSPKSALAAQAIAARTTLISQIGARHLADPYHLCNRQHCQAYHGLSSAKSQTDEAITESRGQVLFFGKSELVASYYSSNCGGFSAGSKETWGLNDKAYLVSQSDSEKPMAAFRSEDAFRKWWDTASTAYCASAPKGQTAFRSTQHARWTKRLDLTELESIVKERGLSLGRLKSVEILERGPSFRVTKLRINGENASYTIERELTIRRFFGGLKSALFVIDVEFKEQTLNAISFKGSGFGHGVGLCQTGAIGMAQRGKSYADILKHYYPNTRIEKLW